MGQLETRSARRRKKQNIQKIVLSTIAAAGVLSIALMAPNALQMLESFGVKPGKGPRSTILRAHDRLLAEGFIMQEGKGLRLTKRGEAELRRVSLADFKLKKPRRWDGKWRVLIFDIPETRRYVRFQIRQTLLTIGFVRVQDSVWAYPYPCEDLLTLLKADFKIGKDLLYLIVEEFEYDRPLKRAFGLH